MKILVYETSQHKKSFFALTQALCELGHDARPFDWESYLYTSGGWSLLNRVKEKILRDLLAVKINHALVTDIKENKYDLMIVVRGDFITANTLSFAKTVIPVVVNWNSDDFCNSMNTSKCMLDCIPLYDCVFTPRNHLASEYISMGAKYVQPLNWYYRPGLLYPQHKINNVNFVYDISFVGSWSKYREDVISPVCDLGLRTCGWGWSKKSSNSFIKKVNSNPQISMDEMMCVFASSKININILTKENRDTTNLRNFEVPAAGGFQLSERSDEILQLFDEDSEIVCFGDAIELKSKAFFYLKNEDSRKRIALRGYERLIRCNHSIVDRARQILKVGTS